MARDERNGRLLQEEEHDIFSGDGDCKSRDLRDFVLRSGHLATPALFLASHRHSCFSFSLLLRISSCLDDVAIVVTPLKVSLLGTLQRVS